MSKRISQVQKPTRTKKKREDVEEPSRFVAQLASLASNDLDNGAQCCSRQGIEEKWKRPLLCLKANKASVDIVLQAIDIDYYTDSSYDMVIRLFGVTQSENSVCLQLHGFLPYFLVRIENSFEKKHIARFMSHLNSLVKAQLSGTGVSKEVEKVVMKMEILHGTSIYGSCTISCYFKLLYFSCRRIFDEGVDLFGNGEHLSFASYEANIDFTIRFMVDLSLVGCGWITVAAGTYEVVPEQLMMSRCQLECTVLYSDLLVHPSDSSPEWSSIAPLRILSFDIECMNRKGIFPEAHTDAIIQIANMVKREGENEPFIRNCFVIGDTDQVIGSDIIVCQNEQEMLERWASFVRTVDPDFITGFNIQNFDIPYIVERAKTLKIENRVTMLGRVRNVLSKVRESQVASKQMGSRMNKVTNMEGRVIFDVYQIVLRDYKLRSYTLNSISYHFLGEQKEDVMYSIIAELQHGDAVSRKRLAVYCMKDAYLPLRLLEKLMSVINYVEMARVTGVPLVFLISRGQQIKVLSQLLRKAKSLNYFLPVIETAVAEETFEGALVIEPKRGFYNEPIVTLDFASLYPSIMIAHNLCYTTLIQSTSDSERLSEEDYIITPSNNRFAKPSLRRGLLPEVLEDLLQARKRVKNELKVETDPFSDFGSLEFIEKEY